jgi:hypothetical protein
MANVRFADVELGVLPIAVHWLLLEGSRRGAGGPTRNG